MLKMNVSKEIYIKKMVQKRFLNKEITNKLTNPTSRGLYNPLEYKVTLT